MDRNVDGKDQYRFNWRARHSTVIVKEVLYCWGGDQGLDESECDCSGDFPKKRQHISVIDEFDFSSGVWSSQPTRELKPTGDNSVTKKGYGGMIAMGSEGEPQQLLVIGGLAPISTTTQYRQFEYHKIPSRVDRFRTNEHNIYNLSSGQWIVPFVSGQCFPPTDNFTIERISHNKGIIYGGSVTDGGKSIPTNSIYLFELSRNTINWESLSKGAIPNDGLWTKERYAHASTIINGASTSPTLVVIGGVGNYDETLNECLLLDTNQYNWMKISLPDSVTGRYYHTVSSFAVNPNHMFLIIVGGYAKREQEDVGGEMKWMNIPVTYSKITMIVELVFNDEGQCSVESVNSGMSRMNNRSLQEELLKIKLEKKMLETQLLETKTLLTKRKRDQEDSPHSNHAKKLKIDELEESVEEKRIMTDEHNEKLRATSVAENEVYMTEIEDEKKQVQFIKETSSVEVQFNRYLIPSIDNLECLSDVQVAEKKLFLIQGDKPQLMNWEKYGLRIGVQEGSLLSSETVEAAMVALVGGQFQFPPNTVLVSAVYAVSLSKPLLKQLKLEIQHCVDLTGRPNLAQYLKFAIAPVDTPSLPYQFSIVEGGEFSFNSGYGSIQRNKFCLVCILGEDSTNGDTEEGEEEENRQVTQQEENDEEEESEDQEEEGEGEDSDITSDRTSSTPSEVSGACRESTTIEETNLPTNTVSVAGPTTTPNTNHIINKVQSTGVKKAVTYAGLVYYEEKRVEDLVTFTAAKKLDALIHYIERKHSQAEIGPDISFFFKFPYDYVELNFDAPQKKPFTGWTLSPHTDPCRLYQKAIDKFGDKEHSRPSCCLISVYGSPDAVPFLNYFIPLEGVAHPVSLNIHRARRNFTVPVPPSTNPTTSSSNTITEDTASSTGGACAPAVDVERVKRIIDDVLVSRDAALNSLTSSLSDLASQLFSVGLITEQVKRTCSMEAFINEFKASLSFMRRLPQVQEHCQKFLKSFIAVRGSYANAAIALGEDWIEAIRNELGFDFNINY
uniref:Uncharacterized protein n=1 Tax=Amphimedon queenslandica TaxID=400682 RepID=A0A1X7TT68_AMPQE